jgi:hypothetical protein
MLTPIKAIRAKCLDCSAGSDSEVRSCTISACPLWPYRMGKRPEIPGKPKRTMSPERRALLLAALAKHRVKKLSENF